MGKKSQKDKETKRLTQTHGTEPDTGDLDYRNSRLSVRSGMSGRSHMSQVSIQDVSPRGCFRWYYLIFILVIILIVSIMMWDSKKIEEWQNNFVSWIRENPKTAVGVLILMYIIFCTFNLPTPYLHIIIGYSYSQLTGSIWYGLLISVSIAFVGTMLGGWNCFILSRYCFRDYVINKIDTKQDKYPWLQNFYIIDEIFQNGAQSIKIIALMRLAIIPYNLSNYILGVTSVRFINYAIGNCAHIYKCIIECYIGCRLWQLEISSPKDKKADQQSQNPWVILQIIIALLGSLAIAFYAKNLIDDQIDIQKQKEVDIYVQSAENESCDGHVVFDGHKGPRDSHGTEMSHHHTHDHNENKLELEKKNTLSKPTDRLTLQ